MGTNKILTDYKPEVLAEAFTKFSSSAATWLRSFKTEKRYSELVRYLYPGVSEAEEKLLKFRLYTLFRRNKKSIKTIFARICHASRTAVPVACSTPKNSGKRYCVCNIPYDENDDDMVHCSGCDNWFHLVCLNVDLHNLPKVFRCPSCRSNRRGNIRVPTILLEKSSIMPGIHSSTLPSEITENLDSSIIETVASNIQDDHTEHVDDLRIFGPSHTQVVTTCQDAPESSRHILADPEDQNHMSLLGSPIIEHSVRSSESCSEGSDGSLLIDEESLIADIPNFSGTKDLKNPISVATEPGKTENLLSHHCGSTPKYLDEPTFPRLYNSCIATSDFSKFYDINADKPSYGYTQYLKELYQLGNRACCVEVTSYKITRLAGMRRVYVYMKCKHNNYNCVKVSVRVHFSFPPLRPVKVLFRTTGEFRHVRGEAFRNQVAFKERDKHKSYLLHQKAAAYASVVNSHPEAVKKAKLGNSNLIIPRPIIRQIRHERLKAIDFENDVFADIDAILQQEASNGETFIRHYGQLPFVVVLISNQQLQVLKELRNIHKDDLVFHLDSTGSLIKTLNRNYAKKPIYLYSLVVSCPKQNCPPVPLLQFITNSHSKLTISHCLETFKSVVQKFMRQNDDDSAYVCKRFETDFSFPLIKSILSVYFRENLKEYLDGTWKTLFKKFPNKSFNLHVCRSHATKFMLLKAKECFGKGSNEMEAISAFIHGFLQSHRMASIFRRTEALFQLCLTKTNTEKISELVLELTRRNTTDDYEKLNEATWLNYEVTSGVKAPISNKVPLHRQSLFGNFFHLRKMLASQKVQQLNTTNHDPTPNSYYNPRFVKYLLVHILPYVPLLTHIAFPIDGDNGNEDHQTSVEMWHRILKIDELPQYGGQVKCSRLIQYMKNILKGRLNEYEMNLYTEAMKPRKYRIRKHAAVASKAVKISASPNVDSDKVVPISVQYISNEATDANSPLARESIRPSSTGLIASNCKVSSHETAETMADIPTEEEIEVWRRKGTPVAFRHHYRHQLSGIPFMPWGSLVQNGEGYVFTNTCALDSYMTVVNILRNCIPSIRDYLRDSQNSDVMTVVKCINLMNERRFNSAKALWYQWITGIMPQKTQDFYGTLSEYGDIGISRFVGRYIVSHYCRNCKYREKQTQNLVNIFAIDKGLQTLISEELEPREGWRKCRSCSHWLHRESMCFSDQPDPFIVLTAKPDTSYLDLPKNLQVFDTLYKLFGTIEHVNSNHFIVHFSIDGNNLWKYDGMSKKTCYEPVTRNFMSKVARAFYIVGKGITSKTF